MNILKNVIHRFQSINGRNRLIIKNVAASFLIKGGSLFLALLTMPAYMRYFENQQILGMWFTILSVLTWVLNFDLGLGNGLRNHLVGAIAENDSVKIKKYISSAYGMIFGIVAVLLIISYISFPYINWNKVFNISETVVSGRVLLETVQIVFTGILLQFLLRLITSVLYALQKSAIPGLLSLITTAILLIFVLTVNSGSIEGNLKMLAYANIIAVNLPLLIANIIIFKTKLKFCGPQIRFFDKRYSLDVIKLGGVFFWLQIMYMLIANTNDFLISWLSGPQYVVDYQIYHKPFMLVSTIFALTLTPIWSAVTQAIAEKDFVWISRLYLRLKRLAVITMVGEFIMIIFLQWFINIWLGDRAINVDLKYALVFAAAGSMFIWNGVISSIVNGIGKLKIQFIFLTVGVIIKFPIAFALTELTGAWIGVVASDIFAMLLFCLIQPIWINKYLKEFKEGELNYV
jgi:O-antigen/teichoic acid export membrane protein